MKKIFLIFVLLISTLLCETYEDVIYLKDGSVIYGTIVEQKPGEYYKIKSGRNILVLNIVDIDIIKKEIVQSDDSVKDISNKTWSIGAGLVSSKSPSLLRIIKDFKMSDNSAIYLFVGLPMNYGLGYNYQKNYNDNGIIFSGTYGVYLSETYYGDVEYLAEGSISLGYQFRVKKGNSFFTLGVMINRYLLDDWYEYYTETEILPVLSWDYRF